MNALDKAFIKAYAKGVPGAAATAAVCEPTEENRERTAAASQNRAAVELARLSPLVEVSAADGVWYRIEPSTPAEEESADTPVASQDIPRTTLKAQAAQANVSAVEMLDSLLGLTERKSSHASLGSEPDRPHAVYVRVDKPEPSPHFRTAPAKRDDASKSNLLPPQELQAFVEGAAASVTFERWDLACAGETAPESLCQCWLATEQVAAPGVIEQSWAEVLPSTPRTAPTEASQATTATTNSPEVPAPAPEAAAVSESCQTTPEAPAAVRHEPASEPAATVTPAVTPEPVVKTEPVAKTEPVVQTPVVEPVMEPAPVTAPEPTTVKMHTPTVEATPPAPAVDATPPAAPAASAPAETTSLPTPAEAPKSFETPKSHNSAASGEPSKAPTPPAAETEKKPALVAFQAAWEVDRLNWPEQCDRLARGDTFGPLAKMLIDASRSGKRVIAVTGVHRGEGRTTLALCLARRAAKEGANVAVLDADFERPYLGRSIGIDMENGWDDVLTDGQPLAEAAVSSLEDRVTVFPLGRRAAALVSAHTVTALQQLAASFDLVLFRRRRGLPIGGRGDCGLRSP